MDDDEKKQQILAQYSTFIEPIIGKGEINERLLLGLEKILLNTGVPNLSRFLDVNLLRELASDRGYHKGAATRLIGVIYTNQNGTVKEQDLTDQMALKMYKENPCKLRNYGKKTDELLTTYLKERKLI